MVPARRLEIDTADSLVAMVAAGIGWALITPLCLLQAGAESDALVVAPLPGGGLARELTSCVTAVTSPSENPSG